MNRRTIALLGALLLATGCSATGGPESKGQGGKEPPLDTALTVRTGSDIKLPLDEFHNASISDRDVLRAEDVLMRSCAKRFGYTIPPAKITDEPSKFNANGRRYGLISADDARTYGYHPSPNHMPDRMPGSDGSADESRRPKGISDEQYSLLLFGESGDIGGGAKRTAQPKAGGIPEGGCFGEARRKLGQGASKKPVIDVNVLDEEAFKRTENDSRVREVSQAWVSCMKKAGYAYKGIWEVHEDARWKSPAPTAQERTTAEADVRCKQETRLATVWFQVESAYQNEVLEKHAEAVQATREQYRNESRNAAKVLADES
ncbi:MULTISPECIES: hypothetical protein [unclassified Streptomyces]|uniref:hypothetical protein n=1 Tax=unclassified Streptomyces TaxID=2593676 RepID=UPI003665DABA